MGWVPEVGGLGETYLQSQMMAGGLGGVLPSLMGEGEESPLNEGEPLGGAEVLGFRLERLDGAWQVTESR